MNDPTVTVPCVNCERDLPLDRFYAAPRNVRRHQCHSWCKDCVTGAIRERRASRTDEQRMADAERNRGYSRKKRLRRYGLTPATYERLLDQQGGVCAICGKPESAVQPHRKTGRESLAVDHDHVTGEVRGLLCLLCNTALGKFGDDPALLRQAIEYLERP